LPVEAVAAARRGAARRGDTPVLVCLDNGEILGEIYDHSSSQSAIHGTRKEHGVPSSSAVLRASTVTSTDTYARYSRLAS